MTGYLCPCLPKLLPVLLLAGLELPLRRVKPRVDLDRNHFRFLSEAGGNFRSPLVIDNYKREVEMSKTGQPQLIDSPKILCKERPYRKRFQNQDLDCSLYPSLIFRRPRSMKVQGSFRNMNMFGRGGGFSRPRHGAQVLQEIC